jgi:V/A-type H+-transporting ATPase subunit E
MGLEEIIREIEKRANKDVEKIKKQLQEERKKILKRAEEEALRARKEIMKRLEKEAQSMKRERITRVRVEEKKKLLALKRKLLAESFKQAEEELRNLDRQEYMSLMKRLLVSSIDSGNEEIVVSAQDEEWMKGDFLKELRKSLEKKGRWKKVQLTPGLREGERGFILKKEGMHLNYTFSNLFLLLREELEIEAANSLLG